MKRIATCIVVVVLAVPIALMLLATAVWTFLDAVDCFVTDLLWGEL